MSGRRRFFVRRPSQDVPDLVGLDYVTPNGDQSTLCEIPIVEYRHAGCGRRVELAPPLYPEEDCELCVGRWAFPGLHDFVVENGLERDPDYQLGLVWVPKWADFRWPAGRYARRDGATGRR